MVGELVKLTSLKTFVKVVLFVIIFVVLSVFIAFVLKDDTTSYSRVLTHEFYNQKNIDILFCGASHVSHGMDPRIADKEFGRNTFNTGTPNQGIHGTYAIIRQAIKSYKISRIYVETDFAVACRDGKKHAGMGKSDFIVLSFLQDFFIKRDFIFENSSHDTLLNAFLPIGKDKLMTLSPKKVFHKIKSLITGEYFKYEYKTPDAGYAGKGCVLDYEKIKEGSFSNDYFEPPFKPISNYWKSYIEKIIKLCAENEVEIVFYAMPCSDFYLHEKGDYNIFYSEMKNYINSLGFEYYDFNLCKEEFSMNDDDYFDDNHLNINGIDKFSRFSCDFFTGKISAKDMFYSSYAQKTQNQKQKIYGLLIIKTEDGKSFEIIPMTNINDKDSITYDISIQNLNGINELAKNTKETKVALPKGTSGKILVKSYVNGILNNSVKENYVAL